jgi:hypothetical protein
MTEAGRHASMRPAPMVPVTNGLAEPIVHWRRVIAQGARAACSRPRRRNRLLNTDWLAAQGEAAPTGEHSLPARRRHRKLVHLNIIKSITICQRMQNRPLAELEGLSGKPPDGLSVNPWSRRYLIRHLSKARQEGVSE